MRSEMYYMPQISPLPPKDHPTHWIGDKSVEYIENCDPEKPMFLVSSYIHPHPPFCPPAPWQKLHREDPPAPFVPRPEDLEDYWELIRDRSCLKRLRISDQDLLRQKNFYYACISFVDYQVGRVIKALKDKGMYDDTLILFASDHGEMMGDHGTMGKRTMMDGSSRIPFIIHYPGQEPGVRTDPVSLVDVAPTLLSFAGIPYNPAEYDGIDLFGGEKHDYVYSQFNGADRGVYMMTDGRNKLIYNSETGRYFFFDTVPSEKNIYSEDNAKAQEMKVLLDAYRASDVCKQSNHEGDVYSKEHPHYVGRMEQALYHDEEMAAIPEGYRLDLLK
jgi:arylsulfatase A-like enzyme